ncbi:MAG: hypothetical protein UZ12_BCD005001878 [Bacteroidetes bacterium OLB12]|nr:MAG: hypothetical protein UZ12_BCD005001878 [Bacteroidetes bacterium OLB12]
MKKIIIGLMMMTASVAVQAQDAVSKFFTKYQNDESFSQVNISSKMFSLMANLDVENPEDKEVVDMIRQNKRLAHSCKRTKPATRASCIRKRWH